MKTFGYLLMAVMACMTCSCRDEEPLPNPVPPVMEPENPGNPEEPDTGKVYIGIAPIIENMQEQRAVVENWKEGHCLGVTAAGDVNIPFTFDGRRWKAGKQVEVTAEQKVSAYYPYNVQYTDMTAIPVDITTQEDYMYGEGGVSVEKPSAVLVMKHALSLVRILIKKNDYTGDGRVDAVTFGGVRLSASMDVTSGKLLPTGQPGEYKAGGNYTLDDASPVYVEAILMPVGTAEGITVNVHVDGRDFTYALPPTHVWNPGMIYTYTLNMKSGYNCEVDVDHVPMDEEYWSTFGKTDRIVMRDCGTDRIYIWPNYTFYGYDTYTGEGKVWGFFLRYRNRGGGEDFAGQARFVLMDGDRIVEQYQPFDIKCGNGAWDGYCKYCYVQAVPGTYRLAVLFKKNGESAWFKPYGYDQNSNDGEWMYEVRPATDMPALRMITLENQKCNTFLAYPVPDNDWFNIVYTLSNKSRKAMKGTVKVVWEREFKLESNSYRPSDKKENKIDDYEWRDELGSCTVDIAAGVRFWKGIVSCKFPIQRANPRDPVSGVGYCTPIAHLYYREEGSCEWKPYGYDQNSNDGEWMYEVRPATDMPALRMITLENQKCNTFLAYPVPDNDWFNIVYTLSNKSRKAMKGTVKVVWEREFKLESNSYRPSDKKENKIDDYEWRDELGSCTVDIAAGVRFWKGIVSCKFPIQRANPRDPVSGVGYCTPIAHLYYREEGSCEWKLLRCDTEYLFNRNYPGSESAKMDEAFNYLGIIPQSW